MTGSDGEIDFWAQQMINQTNFPLGIMQNTNMLCVGGITLFAVVCPIGEIFKK